MRQPVRCLDNFGAESHNGAGREEEPIEPPAAGSAEDSFGCLDRASLLADPAIRSSRSALNREEG
jgi:hypothetical protein